MKDVVIIGAGCAGLTAAIYAARAGKSVLVLEQETIGGQISFSPRVENFPSIASISGAEFSDNLFAQAENLGVTLELECVMRIEPGTPHRVVTDCAVHEANSIIVASGVKHRHLGLAGEDLSGISYCAVCDGAFYKGKSVALAGGGNTALQSAELLAGLCARVHLIHRRNEFRAETALVNRVKQLKNVIFETECVIESLHEGEENALGSITLRRNDGVQKTIDVEGLFVNIGQIPGNEPFADVLTLDDAGYIIAGEDCRTNVDGIFAAGDCRTKNVRQLTTAAADGAVAALAAI